MAQGIMIDGEFPKTKKQLKEVIATEPWRVRAIATSVFGNEHNGAIDMLPKGKEVVFAGPDFQYNRKWYGTIKWNATHTKLVVE